MIRSILNPRRSAAIGPAAAGFLCLVITAGSAAMSGSETADSAPDKGEAISVELNRSETVAGGCRLYFLIHNRTPYRFSALRWDLVFFGTDGLIANRMAAEAAPLPAGKTSVKLYDLADLTCDRLGRVLLNDVLRCERASEDQTPVDCLNLTRPSSRTRIELIK